ncbi:MAG: hypothetical protein JWM48_2905 [Mycobacterium sp.]|nr:hypothetical protein [Mycobacterium sp.]MCW2746355.1 hypothetical protein [Mycobacterium sp.]
MPSLELMSRQELEQLRRELVQRAGLPEDELRRRAEVYNLTPEQSALADEISDLEYLLAVN